MDIWFTLFVAFVAILAATGFALTLIGYINSFLACFQYGWKWALTVVCLPGLGGVIFSYAHRPDHLKTGRQLGSGLIGLLISLALVYGGPGAWFAQRAVTQMMAEQSSTTAPAPEPKP